MIRLLGTVLLVAGCGALGMGAVGRLDGRVQDLRELAAGLENLQRELGWRLSPLPAALRMAAGDCHGRPARFFEYCACGAEHLDGAPFHQLWQEGLERCPLRLEREDRAVLEQLGPVLGRYDGDSQRQALEGAAAALGRRHTEAVEDRRRLGRVYGVLGVTAGLFLAILLI